MGWLSKGGEGEQYLVGDGFSKGMTAQSSKAMEIKLCSGVNVIVM